MSLSGHIVDHILHKDLVGDSTMHVIGVCSNPVRWHSRYRISREWIADMIKTPNVCLTVVEAAFGDRHHELDPIEPANGGDAGYNHVKVRTHSEAWIKESMLNIGYRYVTQKYPKAKYFTFCDMDVFFRDPNWALESVQQLQHFDVIQPWQDCADLAPHGGISRHFRSFGFQHQKRKPKQKHPSQTYYEYAHSGFAWSYTKRFLENMIGAGGSNGPQMNWAVLGSADHHQAFACIGETKDTIHGMMHPSFFRKCYDWQTKAMMMTHGEVGFTVGRIEHKFHGPKGRRYYRERWQILVDHKYDPDKMLMNDPQGLTVLIGNHKLEHAIKLYNRSRFEDSIEEV